MKRFLTLICLLAALPNSMVLRLPAQTLETLVHFSAQVKNPSSGLVIGNDGSFYGTTKGVSGAEAYKITPSGDFTALAFFNLSGVPTGLVQGNDGNFYGTTTALFTSSTNAGSFFRLTTEGASTVASFNLATGKYPSELIQGIDGNFYGTTTSNGMYGFGTIFKITPAGEITTLFSFDGTNGSGRKSKLMIGTDQNFYGTTMEGGITNRGTVFRFTPQGQLTTLTSFSTFTNIAYPTGGLVEGDDGNLYGTTINNINPPATPRTSASGSGTVYKITPSGVLTVLHYFTLTTNGNHPTGPLAKGNDGNFYGTTSGGYYRSTHPSNHDFPRVFRITPTGTVTWLAILSGESYFGSAVSALTLGQDGELYGTTRFGAQFANSTSGSDNFGSVFKVTPNGTLSILSNFVPPKGNNPSDLVQGSDGMLYGTTSSGGSTNYGTIFKMSLEGDFITLASLTNSNMRHPGTGLSAGSDGKLYGTTLKGVSSTANWSSQAFSITLAGGITTLASFSQTNGVDPKSPLLEDIDGHFYGTASVGGSNEAGTVFKLSPEGVLTTLVRFASTNGSNPRGSLAKGADNNFYGTTYSGGLSNMGTVFKMTPSGELTTLVSFVSSNGANPHSGLGRGTNDALYGTTYSGGASNYGTVFKITTSGELTTLVSFTSSNGANPTSELVKWKEDFYGTTSTGGQHNYGTLFRLTQSGELTTLTSFTPYNGRPGKKLTILGDGMVYGTTSGDLLPGGGSIFRLNLSPKIHASSLGFAENQFEFNVSSLSGNPLVIDQSTNLTDWIPVQTNLTGGDYLFKDPQPKASPQRFYRTRIP